MDAPHPSIQKSNRFCAEYSRNKADINCRTLYWRGLVFEEETTPMGHIFDTVDILKPISECLDSKVPVFTDGSGANAPKIKDCEDAAGHGCCHNQVLINTPNLELEGHLEAYKQYPGQN